MSELRFQTLADRIIHAAIVHPHTDTVAWMAWHEFGPDDPRTRDAQRHRREARRRLARLGDAMLHRLMLYRSAHPRPAETVSQGETIQ